ncbi:MAG: molybdopterin-binding protein [Oscillochloris sp.]|nr:molybdopterin-binding protein [Oscillochloris sp.]
MRIEILPPEQAVGHILCHNLADSAGRKAFAKGRIVEVDDLPRFASLGVPSLRVAVLDPGDVHEDVAAVRLGGAVAGPGVALTAAHAGRVNLRAECTGPLMVDDAALLAINDLDGLTVATLSAHRLVRSGDTLATIKVIPFAVPAADMERAEAIARDSGGLLRVLAITLHAVGVILVSSLSARRRVEHGVFPAIKGRVTDLGGQVVALHNVPPDEAAIAVALTNLCAVGAELIIVAGETSVVDSDDVTPRAIRLAGGWIEHYGAPVEPGNLLLMAYLSGKNSIPLPVLGAPGCVRSRDANIVDMLLPRLMAGNSIRRRDIIALGHGGLLSK